MVAIVKPPLLALTKRRWIDGEKIPATGGCIIAMNHVSHLDPLTLGWFLYDHGRLVRYLAKEGSLARAGAEVHRRGRRARSPCARMSEGAVAAFAAAVEAVKAGECVGVYPEGTITRDPDRLADARQDRRGHGSPWPPAAR